MIVTFTFHCLELSEILKILLVFIVLAVIMEFIGLLLTRAIHIEDAAAFLWVGFPSVAVRFIFLTIGTTTSDGLVVVAILVTLIVARIIISIATTRRVGIRITIGVAIGITISSTSRISLGCVSLGLEFDNDCIKLFDEGIVIFDDG